MCSVLDVYVAHRAVQVSRRNRSGTGSCFVCALLARGKWRRPPGIVDFLLATLIGAPMACFAAPSAFCATLPLLECALLLRPDFKSRVTLLSHEKGVPMAPYLGDGDWRSIAEQTSNEMDPTKLMILVEKLCRALDGERRQKSPLGVTSAGNVPGSFTSN